MTDPILLYPRPNIRIAKTKSGGVVTTKVFALHADGLGSVRAVTDPTGAVVERTAYRPYGEEPALQQPLTLAETRGFIGERYDEAAGLQYLNARYYDPRLGMFTQPDWWEVTWPGVGTNRYSYSFNDPVNGSDPGGHWVAPDGIYVDTGDADLYPGFAFDPTKNYAEVGVMAAITAGGVAVTPGIALGVASRYPGAYAFGMEIAMGEIGMTVGIAGAGGATVVGKWARVTESMSARAAAYQKFATGTSAGKSLVVGGAKFDGVTKAGHLLDAKGPGYSGFVEYGKFKDWWSGADELLDQARRQIRAAKGAKIE